MSESRHILHPGNAQAVTKLKADLAAICNAAQLQSFQFAGKTYFNVEAEITGQTNELVVIGAHLDSTAANGPAYVPATDPAPGADDDASGVAGVLEVARALRALADQTTPKRSIRFVLFNAEEQLMRGSWAYAHELKEFEGDPGAPSVVAMLAMDMIGWHQVGLPPFVFEIHSTGQSEYDKAKPASDQLAAALAQAATQVAPNLTAQVHPLPGCTTDPATGRSDHSSFHYHDWPACLLSEDLWVATCAQPAQSGNPDYHKATDLIGQLDLDYAADIARTVAAAAWTAANS